MQKRSAENPCGSSPAPKEPKSTEVLAATSELTTLTTEIFKQHPSLTDLYQYLKHYVKEVDKPIEARQEANVCVLMSLYCAVNKTLCEREMYNDEQIAYVENIIPRISSMGNAEERRQTHREAAASIMHALLLFDRFKGTFESPEAIVQWFDGIQQSACDEVTCPQTGHITHVVRKTYHMPDREKNFFAKFGTCTVFAMCVGLALKMQEDKPPLLDQYRSVVFGDQKHTQNIKKLFRSNKGDDNSQARKMCKVDQYALFLFELAVLDRIGWKTHVSVEEYMESVRTLPRLKEDERQAILQMLAQHAGPAC